MLKIATETDYNKDMIRITLECCKLIFGGFQESPEYLQNGTKYFIKYFNRRKGKRIYTKSDSCDHHNFYSFTPCCTQFHNLVSNVSFECHIRMSTSNVNVECQNGVGLYTSLLH